MSGDTTEAMRAALTPCPFCGAGETHIHVNQGTWTGMRYGEPVSVEVRHFCTQEAGQPSRMLQRIGRDEASAIAAWNRRAHPAPAAPAVTDSTHAGAESYLNAAGHLDANGLESMAKAHPDEMFLKGSGVLKLTGAIRQLERELRDYRAAQPSPDRKDCESTA